MDHPKKVTFPFGSESEPEFSPLRSSFALGSPRRRCRMQWTGVQTWGEGPLFGTVLSGSLGNFLVNSAGS